MAVPFRIAAVQMDVQLAQIDANLARMLDAIRETHRNGARLTCFPECALTGYCFDGIDEAQSRSQPIPGPATERIAQLCRELDVFAIFGLVEADAERLFNACSLVGPLGVVGSYRKIHLPLLGLDRFVTPGDRPFEVHSAESLRVGLNICYDSSFPESARIMTLQGADLIALPTNWPPGAECVAAHTTNTRAMENVVYYAAVNRVGTERGFQFIGQSRICDPLGNTLASADHQDEAILYADVDVDRARNKRLVRVPGQHEIDRVADRRPEMYGRLTER